MSNMNEGVCKKRNSGSRDSSETDQETHSKLLIDPTHGLKSCVCDKNGGPKTSTSVKRCWCVRMYSPFWSPCSTKSATLQCLSCPRCQNQTSLCAYPCLQLIHGVTHQGNLFFFMWPLRWSFDQTHAPFALPTWKHTASTMEISSIEIPIELDGKKRIGRGKADWAGQRLTAPKLIFDHRNADPLQTVFRARLRGTLTFSKPLFFQKTVWKGGFDPFRIDKSQPYTKRREAC